MPSYLHEALVELVRDRPDLAVDLMARSFGAVLPEHASTTVESGELTELAPTEYRADTVVVLRDPDRRPVWAVIVEVQLRRDPDKRWTWRAYVGGLSARLHCPVTLLVLCPNPRVAAWCAEPIELGLPGTRLGQLVVGPDRVPVITDPAHAHRFPELAVLSAIAHGGTDFGVLGALPAAFAAIDPGRAGLYCDIVLDVLPAAARNHLEALVTTGTHEYRSEFLRNLVTEKMAEALAEGRAQGEARAVLAVLRARGIEVPDHARARISDCTDLDQLDRWVERVATVGTVEDLFTEPLGR